VGSRIRPTAEPEDGVYSNFDYPEFANIIVDIINIYVSTSLYESYLVNGYSGIPSLKGKNSSEL
jgi:hypothetical protein